MKNICFVLHADLFTPWPVVRAVREIAVLREHGFRISVVSWIKDGLDLPGREKRDGVEIHRFFLSPPKSSILKRYLTYKKILKDISGKVVELKPDAIVCHDLEILPAGVRAKKKLSVPLFFDAHENWPEMVAQNSKMEARLFAFNEKRMLKHVSHSYTYGPDLTEKYKQMGHSATTLYNSKSVSDIPDIGTEDVSELKRKFGFSDSDFIVGFSGSVNLENGTQQVIDALLKLPENVKFLVVGGSGRKRDLEEVKTHARRRNVEDRVVFTGRVPSQELLKLTACFDLGTALFKPLSANQVARVPNKLFDYMAMSVPILASDFPNMSRIVTDAKCGVSVPPLDMDKIAKAISHFQDHPGEGEKMGRTGREKFEKVYSWDMQKKKLQNSHPLWCGEI